MLLALLPRLLVGEVEVEFEGEWWWVLLVWLWCCCWDGVDDEVERDGLCLWCWGRGIVDCDVDVCAEAGAGG